MVICVQNVSRSSYRVITRSSDNIATGIKGIIYRVHMSNYNLWTCAETLPTGPYVFPITRYGIPYVIIGTTMS